MKLASFLLVFILTGISLAGLQSIEGWSQYGGLGGQKFSETSFVHRGNVSQLGLAWEYSTQEHKPSFQTSPIVMGKVMYFCSANNKVVALNAEDGTEIWTHTPTLSHKTVFQACRGVSYWKSGEKSLCGERVLTNTITGQLIALDGVTGQLCPDFGEDGVVDLFQGLGTDFIPNKGEVFWTSAPLVHGDQIVIGGGVLDNVRVNPPSGVIRSFDVRTGKLKWSWTPAPKALIEKARDRIGTPAYGDYLRGTPNSWAPMTSDLKNDLVSIPMGNASPDYLGGARFDSGISKFSSSIVALNGGGKLVWSFQTVDRDVWDYDIGAQPLLADLDVNGEPRDVVIVGTKAGFTFVLDRFTGSEVFPSRKIEVPKSKVPGEKLATHQKIPTFPPPISEYSMQEEIPQWWLDKLKKANPEYEAYCKNLYGSYPDRGLFAAPSEEGLLQNPGPLGGINWSGFSFNPKTKVLMTNVNLKPYGIRLIPRDKCEDGPGVRPMIGEKYCLHIDTLMAKDSHGNVADMHCFPPPYGKVVAYDLKSKKTLWNVPLGSQNGEPGAMNIGGILSTGADLSFIGSAKDKFFRALDSRTGKVLWEYQLPAVGAASPISYSIDGKQYIAIAVGGNYFLDPLSKPKENKILVFSLQ